MPGAAKPLVGAFQIGSSTVRMATADLLAEVANGPLTMAGDSDAAKAKRDSVLVVKGKSPPSEYYGPKGTALGEIDLIAVREETMRKQSCGNYRGGGKNVTVTINLRDVKLTVFDRRTGKALGTESFPSPAGTCPKSVLGGGGSNTISAPIAPQTAFIKSFLKP